MNSTAHVQQAEVLLKQGNPEQAIANCRFAIQADPHYALAYKVMGNACQVLNRFDDAGRCYAKAIEVKPDFAEAHANLGNLYALRQQWQQAIASYQTAISLKPNFAGAYRNLAQIWQAIGNTAEANKCHNQLLNLERDRVKPKEQLQAGNSFMPQVSVSAAVSDAQSKNGNGRNVPILNSAILNIGDTLGSFNADHETVANYIQQAELHIDAQRWQAAIAACQQAIQIKPETAVAYKMLGNIMQKLGKITEAMQFYQRALQLQPNFAEVHANLGSLHVQQQQWQQAISHYRQAISIKPDFGGAYRNLSKIWKQLGKFAEASECRYKALQLEPATATPEELTDVGSILLRYGKVDKAIAAYRQAIAIAPNFIGAYFNLATVLTQQGEFAEANACYRKVMELNLLSSSQAIGNGRQVVHMPPATAQVSAKQQSQPTNSPVAPSLPELLADPDVYLHLAESYLAKRKYKQAIAICKQIVMTSNIAAQNIEAFRILGIASQALGEWKNAEQYLQSAIKLQPTLATTHDHLGNLYTAQKQWQKALLSYQKAIKLDPRFAEAYRHLAGVWMQLGQKSEGAECWYRSFQLEPNWANAKEYLNLGNMLLQQNKVEKATNCYQRAIQIDPRLSQSHHNLGEIFSSRQDWDQAIAAYSHAVLADPHHASSHYAMGKAFAAQGKYTEALSCYREAIISANSQGDHADASAYIKAYESMGEAFITQDNWEDAINCYQEILELVPENTDIQNKLGKALETFGSNLIAKGEVDEVIAIYQKAIAAYPTAQLHHQLAEMLSQQQNYAEAEVAYQSAIRLDPENSWSHNNLGDVFRKQEKWEESVAAYREAIQLNPDFAWSHYNLAEALTHIGEWDSAIAAYRQAIQLQADLPWICGKLADALEQRSQMDLEDAYGFYRQAIAQQPSNLDYYYRAIDLQPNEPSLYVGLADQLAAQEKVEAAIVFYRIALQLQPNLTELKAKVERLSTQLKRSHQASEFDWQFYREYNDDLQGIESYEQAYQHWQESGQLEERCVSETEMYRRIGYRKSDLPDDFDWQEYLELNRDLKVVYPNNRFKAAEHYLTHGRAEKRLYSKKQLYFKYPTRESQSLVKSGLNLDLPKIKKRLAVLVHIYYFDLWTELRSYIQNLEGCEFDLFINVVESIWHPSIHDRLRQDYPQAQILISPNRGKDIGGYLALMKHLDWEKYDLFCLIHTKKSPHCTKRFADRWRTDLLTAILGSKEIARENLDMLRSNPSIGLIGSIYWRNTEIMQNQQHYNHLLDEFDIKPEARNCEYLSGTMTLVKAQVLQPIYEKFQDTELENGDDQDLEFHMDGQIAHAIERIIGNLVRHQGMNIYWHD